MRSVDEEISVVENMDLDDEKKTQVKRKNEESDDDVEQKVVQPKKRARKSNVIDSDSGVKPSGAIGQWTGEGRCTKIGSDYAPDPEDEGERSASEEFQQSPKTPKSKLPGNAGSTESKRPLAARTPVTPKTPVTPRTPITPAYNSSRAAANLAKFSRTPSDVKVSSAEPTQYLHHTLKWLKPETIKDREKRPPSHEDYDARSLHVPLDFLSKCTPGMRQWWEIKSKNFDLILFFKVGKFYELYHMDAEIAVKELGLIYMKGTFAHCGFPEKAFGRYSETLVQKGFRVARIEQTSRPGEIKGKPVSREVCAVITKGTKTHSVLEGQSPEVQNCYLMAVCEEEGQYGVCLIDTSVGVFTLSQFSDDRHSSRLRTLISHYNIVQVLHARREISNKLQNVLKMELGHALREPLSKEKEFWGPNKTLNQLASGKYFVEEGQEDATWPKLFTDITVGEEGSFNAEPKEEFSLAVSSLGACIFYLKKCLIERPLLAMKQFQLFTPEQFHVRNGGNTFPSDTQKLVLDNISIVNLEILQTSEGKHEGSLLSILDRCVTAAGKRLLRQWVCAPLCNPQQINQRLDAIDNLLANPGKVKQVRTALKKVPDLERLLRKIHAQGVKMPREHPDSRAVMFEVEVYSKKKIVDLVNSLDGFGKLVSVIALFEDVQITSELLKEIASVDAEEGFPDLTHLLKFYQDCFNKEEALQKGIIVPKMGVNDDYDNVTSEIETIEEEFQTLLRKYKSQLQCGLNFFGAAKNRFQVEVPESASKKVPSSWEVQSQRKGFVRYYFPEARKLKADLEKAEIRKEDALKDTMRVLFHKFSKHYDLWSRAVKCSAILDVLLSLALYGSSHGTTRPEIVVSKEPFLKIEDGTHPTLMPSFSPGEFIPNDTSLGGDQKLCLVVTGPNMGGKSTLMRQVGLLVILAQMGCRVPAASMSFSPVDRIFTRLGASDNIVRGESTFFVELSETSTILTHASKHSLVLLDELGRGTATYDGTAIAGSVIENISREIQSRTLFSTHYHRLVDELGERGEVTLGHMSCLNNNEEDEQDITFLYKLSPGSCPKSFGFNAARLAGIPEPVITNAHKISNQFERLSDRFHIFGKLLKSKSDLDQICSRLGAILSS
ncbi:hypothetical protein ACHWQZ_G012010 [Mnemiopsis leidyi]